MGWRRKHRRRRSKAARYHRARLLVATADRWVAWYRREGCLLALQEKSPHQYVLIDGRPRPCGRLLPDRRWLKLWGNWFEATCERFVLSKSKKHRYNRHVADDTINSARVSTVFLGIDHGFGLGKPRLYETMVFDDSDWEGFQRRYATRAEAEAGHRDIVDQVRHGMVLEHGSEDVDILWAFVNALKKSDEPVIASDEWPEEVDDGRI